MIFIVRPFPIHDVQEKISLSEKSEGALRSSIICKGWSTSQRQAGGQGWGERTVQNLLKKKKSQPKCRLPPAPRIHPDSEITKCQDSWAVTIPSLNLQAWQQASHCPQSSRMMLKGFSFSMGSFGWGFKVAAVSEWGDVDKDFCVVNGNGEVGFG